MNYGESLAYWYFRLNGFLPLTNFVLHRPDIPKQYNADCDLLAVRFPHVFEKVGGQANDWDNDRFAGWRVDHFHRTVCMIVEIKTGKYGEVAVNRAFRQQRLLYALRRLGVVPLEDCDDLQRRLSQQSVIDHREFCFAKVLISNSALATGAFDNTTPHLHLELVEALAFIRARMNRYRGAKEAARMFFPSDLIQFFAWEAGLPLVDAQPEREEE